jgi:hypothetical protein
VQQMSEPIVRGLVFDHAAVFPMFKVWNRSFGVSTVWLDLAHKYVVEQDSYYLMSSPFRCFLCMPYSLEAVFCLVWCRRSLTVHAAMAWNTA